jgi:polyisoprenoid-binding protein YceI
MKIKFLLILALAFASISQKAFSQDDHISIFVVDTARSYVEWNGKKLTGEHFGRVKFDSSTVEMKNGKLTKGTLNVAMNTINCLDIEDAKLNAQLVRHLKSPDFFDVWKYPNASLTFKMTIPNPTAKKGQPNYTLIADMQIKDSTHTITIPAEVRLSDKEMKAVTEFTFDRTKYDVRFNSKKFFPSIGDKLIEDTVKIKTVVYLIRKKDLEKLLEEERKQD